MSESLATGPQKSKAGPTPVQLTAEVVDTPVGQRLALGITLMLGADQAKAFATRMLADAEGMSESGLHVGSTLVTS